MDELLFEDSLLESMEVIHNQESEESYADDFLFEDSLLESMEVLSFEERDIDEVVRENAHALLDAEMDLEEILYESNIEVVNEGFIETAISKIKALFAKIKEYIRKFIDWLKSLFKKKESAGSAKSKDSKSDSNKNGGSKSKPGALGSGSGSSSNKNSGSETRSNDTKTDSKTNTSVGIGAGSAKPDSKVEILNMAKLKSSLNSVQSDMYKALDAIEGDNPEDITEEQLKQAKSILANTTNRFGEAIDASWETVSVDKIITVSNGKTEYHSVNKEFLESIEMLQKYVIELEREYEEDIKGIKSERAANMLTSLAQFTVAQLNKMISLSRAAYNKDMNNRAMAIKDAIRAKRGRKDKDEE